MAQPVIVNVRVYPGQEPLARAVAEQLVALMIETASGRGDGHFSLAVSGGATPQILYEMLADEFSDLIPWDKVHLYWGDERYVSKRDPRSNFRMMHEAALHDVQIPLENIHPMPTHRTNPDDAARDYERFMRTQFEGAWPRFDVVLLGMGQDGHTASLLPGSPALSEDTRWVAAVEADVDPPRRLTLTLPVLNAAAHVYFLVTGSEKAGILGRVLANTEARYPAAAVQPSDGELVWWVDEAAAAELDTGPSDRVRVEHYRGVSDE